MRNITMNAKKLINGLLNVFCWVTGIGLFVLLLQIFCFASFKIPSDSMEPALSPGDKILVNKLTMGARLFDVAASLRNEDINIHRVPSLGKLKRNDVIVFNFPYPCRWDSISFDVMKYYVKRCVALPGDTLEIRKGFFRVKGYQGILGNEAAQQRISSLPDNGREGIVMGTFPYSGELNWTVKEFGPLPVPAKGQIVKLDHVTGLLYAQLINWEQKRKITMRGDTVLLGDSVMNTYQFRENYYFVAGDNSENSQDSRYWGLLPEKYIVGKATTIWKSEDPYTKKIRWERVWSKIK